MKLASRLTLILLIGFCIAVLLSGWCGLFEAGTWWFIALSGTAFPVLLLINIGLIPVVFFLKKKWALIPICVLILCLPKLPLIYSFGTNKLDIPAEISSNGDLKVMTFNVRLFDLYNWSHSEETRQKIINYIKSRKPDVICFQEFFSSKVRHLDNIADLKMALGMPYYHAEYSVIKYTSDFYGVATFSRYPLIKGKTIARKKETTNLSMYSDLVFHKDTIRIFNCHLQSVKFGNADYRFLAEIQESGKDVDEYSGSLRILKRLKKAYHYRAEQSRELSACIEKSPYPVILCGDFNDTPVSYSYRTISDQLVDCYEKAGRGFWTTYAGPIPGLRIDYILHSPSLTTKGFLTQKIRLSDHYPVEAVIGSGS